MTYTLKRQNVVRIVESDFEAKKLLKEGFQEVRTANAKADVKNATEDTPELSRIELKNKARELGLEFPNNIKTDKLEELIKEAQA